MQRTARVLTTLGAGLAAALTTAQAGIYTWDGTSGTWGTAAKWGGTVPGATDTAVISFAAGNSLSGVPTTTVLAVTSSVANAVVCTWTAATASNTLTIGTQMETLGTGNLTLSNLSLATPTLKASAGSLTFNVNQTFDANTTIVMNGGALRVASGKTMTLSSSTWQEVSGKGNALRLIGSSTLAFGAVVTGTVTANSSALTVELDSTATNLYGVVNLDGNFSGLGLGGNNTVNIGTNANGYRNAIVNLKSNSAIGPDNKVALKIDGGSGSGTAKIETYLDGATLFSNSVVMAGNSGTAGQSSYLLGGKNAAGTTATWAGNITATANAASYSGITLKSVNAGAVLAFTGAISASDRKIIVEGPGTVRLSGSNSYTGGTLVNSGVLEVRNDNALGTNTVTVAGGVLDLTANSVANVINITGTGAAVRLATSTAALTTNFASGSLYKGLQRLSTGVIATTTADLLGGAAGGSRAVTTSWTNDTHGNGAVVSDVLDLAGTSGDVYVLQLTYSDNAYDTTAMLGWYNTGSSSWVNAGSTYVGDLAYNGSLVVGDWGRDTTNNTVWAVLNHNSEYAVVVPEPAALALLGLGGLALLRRRRAAV